MSGQHAVRSTWPKPNQKSRAEGRGSFDLPFKLGPLCLAQPSFDLTAIDLGSTAISGEDVDARFLPSDQMLFLRCVPDHLQLESSTVFDKMLVHRPYRYDRSWVVTEGSFESYLGSFSKTSRKGLKRRTKKLVELSGGSLDIRRYDQAECMNVFHDDARIVSAKTFQEKLMDDGLPADHSFVADIEAKALDGQCYGSILYLDQRPISYLYSERSGLGWLAIYGGFDPAQANLSPGTVHLLADLEDAFDDKSCAFFDFGPGPSTYKQFFSTHDVPCSDLLILDKTLKNRVLIECHKLLGKLTDLCMQLATSLQLKEWFRQRIRGR